jgi:hypothetical protein
MEGVLNGYVTNPNPTPTLTPNPNRNPNSNPNRINEKIQKETTLEIDQITKCQFGRWKLVKTEINLPELLAFCPTNKKMHFRLLSYIFLAFQFISPNFLLDQ